jgi:hypothetical protein
MAHRAESDQPAKEASEPLSPLTAMQNEVLDYRLVGLKAEAKAGQKPELIQVDDKEASDSHSNEDALHALTKLKPEDLGPGMKQAREAAIQLEGEKDIKSAAASYQPKFEAAVKQSDSDYSDSMTANWGKVGMARMEVMMRGSTFMGAVQSINGNIKELPEEKRQEVSTIVNLLQRDTISPELTAALRKELGQYPDVLKSFDTAKAAEGQLKKASESLAQAQEPLLKAAAEQAMARIVLADVKALQGDTSAAFLLKQQAREQFEKTQGQIIGRPVENKPALQA